VGFIYEEVDTLFNATIVRSQSQLNVNSTKEHIVLNASAPLSFLLNQMESITPDTL